MWPWWTDITFWVSIRFTYKVDMCMSWTFKEKEVVNFPLPVLCSWLTFGFAVRKGENYRKVECGRGKSPAPLSHVLLLLFSEDFTTLLWMSPTCKQWPHLDWFGPEPLHLFSLWGFSAVTCEVMRVKSATEQVQSPFLSSWNNYREPQCRVEWWREGDIFRQT